MIYFELMHAVTSVVSDFLQPYALQSSRLLCPWNSPGRSTEAGCRVLLQGIFLTQVLNPHLLPLPVLAGRFLTTSATCKACDILCCCGCSVAQSCLTLSDPMDCSMPGFSVLHMSQSLLKLMFFESVIPSSHLLCPSAF